MLTRGISRRNLLKAAGAGAAVAAGGSAGLFGGKAPAFAQGTTLHVVQQSNFVPDIDAVHRKFAGEFEKLHNVTVKMEFIGTNDVLPRAIAGTESKSGADIFELYWNQGWLFGNNGDALLDLGDVVQAVGASKWHKFNLDAVRIRGTYRGIPKLNIPSVMTYNKKICDPLGLTKYPDTYDELKAFGTKLKQAGKPIGWCLGHTLGDGAFGNYPIVWSWGGAETDEKGRVIINSKQTLEAVKWFRDFWKVACDDNGMAWNDANNNQAYLAETTGCVLNAASIYIKARRDAKQAKEKGDNDQATHWTELADMTRHTIAPKGPAGRYHLILPFNWHVMGYTKNPKLSKELVRYFTERKQMEQLFTAGQGFATGVDPFFDNHPWWKTDPLMEPYKECNKYARNMGYKGPFNRGSAEVQAKYIIADMLARGIQQDPESAVKWAENELKLIYKA